jgi:hypothetical protein
MKIIQIFLLLFVSVRVCSQNTIDAIINFYNQADMDCYYSMIEQNVNRYFLQEHKNWKQDKLGIPCDSIIIMNNNGEYNLVTKKYIREDETSRVCMDTTRIVPLLAVQFINTDEYKPDDNIYNNICIDSTIVFSLASVDKHNKLTSLLHFFDGYFGYYDVLSDPAKLYSKNVIQKIQKFNPSLMLVAHFKQENLGYFLFIKDSAIYVYDTKTNKCVELNIYLKNKYRIEEIRSFNHVYIPLIYTNKMETRTTGNTPIEQINICK